jgi:hypothetical protein
MGTPAPRIARISPLDILQNRKLLMPTFIHWSICESLRKKLYFCGLKQFRIQSPSFPNLQRAQIKILQIAYDDVIGIQ